MSTTDPIVYLNGVFLSKSRAAIAVEDRGSMFADGVYEVLRYYGGRPLAMPEHLERLRRSLAGIRLAEPPDTASLPEISNELVKRNSTPDAAVYWHVTRGAACSRTPRPRCSP